MEVYKNSAKNHKQKKVDLLEQFYQDPFHLQESHLSDCYTMKPTNVNHSSDTWNIYQYKFVSMVESQKHR